MPIAQVAQNENPDAIMEPAALGESPLERYLVNDRLREAIAREEIQKLREDHARNVEAEEFYVRRLQE